MKITIVSDADSWLVDSVHALSTIFVGRGHDSLVVHEPDDIPKGDVCFLLGCSKILKRTQLARNRFNLVVHESDLPEGRGWSPMTWQVLAGRSRVCVSLISASEPVDSGDIFDQVWIELKGHELVDEWRTLQAAATLELCQKWVGDYPRSAQSARPQSGTPSHLDRRGPEDSRLDPAETIASQFNLLRVVDNERYPAFFELHGRRYRLRIDALKG